jgi:N-acetylneuraminic acid mutarotase
VLADGSLLVIGGTEEVVTPSPNGDAVSYLAVTAVRRFDPDTGTTVEVAPLPAPRTGTVAVRLADGRVLVAGGSEQARLESGVEAPPTATAFLYDAGSNSWATTAPMPFANSPGQAVLLADGSVLVTGGSIPYPEAVADVCEEDAVGWTARFTLAPATGG